MEASGWAGLGVLVTVAVGWAVVVTVAVSVDVRVGTLITGFTGVADSAEVLVGVERTSKMEFVLVGENTGCFSGETFVLHETAKKTSSSQMQNLFI